MKIFIRIDDVGNWMNDSKYLRPLLDRVIAHQLPFNLQVVPQWMCGKSASYLTDLIKNVPDLVEIDQHGFSHDLREFSAGTNGCDQQHLIEKGRDLLNNALNIVPLVFTPPEHIYTKETIASLNATGFRVLSKQVKPTFDGKVFYIMGRFCQRLFLFGKRVSYHGGYIPGTQMREWSIAVESSRGNRIKPLSEIRQEFLSASKQLDVVGFLIHHSCLSARDDMKRIFQAIDYLGDLGKEHLFNFRALHAVEGSQK